MNQPPSQQRGLLRLTTGRPCSLKAGRDHTVNGERVHILSVDDTTLGAITHDDARLLGHKGTAAFKRDAVETHDHAWWMRADRTDADMLNRFAVRWAHRTAWLIRYRAAEKARFMARPVLGRSGDYTGSAARSIDPDAECVDTATQERYSKDALAFCIGRQHNRQKEANAERERKRRITHPAPWWEAA